MSATPPQVVIIAGPNGAGKSTLAPDLLRDSLGLFEYVNADTIAQGLSAFNPEGVSFEAGRIMLDRLHSLGKANRSFAFESTLATLSYSRWLTRLKKRGYKVHIVFIWVRDPELALLRIKERVRMGGHDVPEKTVRRRYERGVRNFFHLYQPLADSWSVFDNSEEGEPKLVAIGKGKSTLDLLKPDIWEEIKEASI